MLFERRRIFDRHRNPFFQPAEAEVESKYDRRSLDAQAGHGGRDRPVRQVHNAAGERNCGYVPLTEAEVRHCAKDLEPILDEKWAFVAEKDGETVGAALSLLDYDEGLIHLDGRLLPFG